MTKKRLVCEIAEDISRNMSMCGSRPEPGPPAVTLARFIKKICEVNPLYSF